jgi:hypothetical protein
VGKRKIHKVNFILVLYLLAFCTCLLGKNNKGTIDLYPIKPKIIYGEGIYVDEEEGGPLLLENLQTSNHIKDNSGIDYSIKSARGGLRTQAWCMHGNGKGEWFKADIPESEFYLDRGIRNIYRILIQNGLVANKELYYANNRVKTIEIEFSEGGKRILHLNDGDLEFQYFRINIKARWFKMTIRDVYKGRKYNDTCVGKILFETMEHPNEMSPEKRKRYGYE